nr:glucoamylase [Candidatus Pantoea persica]
MREKGRRAEITHLDLADPQEGGRSLSELIAWLGRTDALVNNAGANVKSPFLDTPFEEWHKVFSVDVDGAFVCGQIAARKMVEQGDGGHIINITSVHEHTPLPDAVAYTAAKHAMDSLTKSMAISLIKENILVNSVAPCAIATPMNNMGDGDAQKIKTPEIPMERPGDVREIASLMAWIAQSGPATPPASPLSLTAALCWPTRSSTAGKTSNRRAGCASDGSPSAAQRRRPPPRPARGYA